MNYYNYNQSRYKSGYIRPRFSRGAVGNIIIANVVIYLIMVIFQAQNFFAFNFGLVPSAVLKKGYIWQLLTYMFIHGRFSNISWNLSVMWIFGMEIEH